MRKTERRLLTLLLCCALLLCATPAGAVTLVSNTGFPDVERGAWYEEALLLMQNYTQGVISGYPDGTFKPDNTVTRGEFLKMAMTIAEGYTADKSRNSIHWAGEYYTIALENNVLISDAFSSSEPMFPCTAAALDQTISRYEMAVILSNTCVNMLMEPMVVATKAVSNIPDYESIGSGYVTAVEQAYGKGVLTGYEDGSFQGDNLLRRCEAATAVFRLYWANKRVMPDWAEQPVVSSNYSSRPVGFQSFAEWLQNGHVNAYGQIDAEARLRLFGDATKDHFNSATEAAPFMRSVSVPIWAIDGKTGTKYSTTASLTVHYLVADEVQLIFNQIYNDPEQFPIYGYSVGGARFSDTMRHSWGCAIDVNALFNCECNFRSGYQRVTCGYGWWPYGMDGQTWVNRASGSYHGSLSQASPYSISPYGSVVKAFADYGWGWGGSGSNVVGTQRGWSGGNSFDFMHFSVLPSGG